MKIVLGVESPESCQPAISMLKRLNFEGAEIDVVHVVETLQFPGNGHDGEEMDDAISWYRREREGSAAGIVKQTAEQLAEAGYKTREIVLHGYIAAELILYAARADADLVAISGKHVGVMESFFTGSIGRSLLIGARCNVLIVKGEEQDEGPVDAVLATDHSEYMQQCVNRLCEMQSKGFGKVTVTSAHAIPRQLNKFLEKVHPSDEPEWLQKNEELLAERNEKVRTQLSAAGIESDSLVACGKAVDVINEAMKQTGADLLVLGAQGHGFVESIRLGSTSFKLAIGEPHSILILRVVEGGG